MTDEKLSDKIDKTNKLLEEMLKDSKLPKEKKFNFPKVPASKLKKGYILVLVLRSNLNLIAKKLPIVNGNVYLSENKTYHLTESQYIGLYKGKIPFVIIPEWSIEPLTREVLVKNAEDNKTLVKPQRQLIHLMEDANLLENAKPKRSFRGIIIIGLVLVGLYYLASSQGWI